MVNNLFSIAVQLLGFCIFMMSFLNYYKYRTGTEFSQNIFKGAKMYRDTNGVPHIESDLLEDAYFALGFAQAEDRLWSIYFNSKLALGELSELFGESALKIDKFSRVLNFREVCDSSLKSLDKEEYKLFKAFSDGINHYINTTPVLPLEFLFFGVSASDIKWEPKSSCLQTKLVEYFLTNDFYSEMIRTYFFENLNFPKEYIEKIMPFKYNHFQYHSTIIKNDEMKDKKFKKITKTFADVKTKYEDEVGLDNKIKHLSEKSVGSLEINESELNAEVNKLMNKKGGIGSNSYVISGKFTENGHSFLVNDPHLENSMPSFWYFSNIKVTNDQFTGAGVPGVPGIFVGSNSYLSWGVTNGYADTSDIFRIEKSRVDSNMVINLDDSHYYLQKRKEKIYTNLKKTNFIELEFIDSDIGAVINGYSSNLIYPLKNIEAEVLNEEKYYYILRSTCIDKKDQSFKAMINFPRSKNINSFRQNLSQISMSLNIVFVDKKDNIGYQLTGKIPIKHSNDQGLIKTVNSSSDLDHQIIPFNDLPYLINPERGYIVTANNPAINQDYIFNYHGAWSMGARAIALENQISEKISKKEKINVEFIINNLLNNINDPFCSDMIKLIFEHLNRVEYDVEHNLLLKNLKNFDCVMKGESTNALVYNVFENEILHNLHLNMYLHDNIKPTIKNILLTADERNNFLIYKLSSYKSNPKLCLTEYKKTCEEFFIQTFNNSIETIKTELGLNMSNWKWKNINVKHYPNKPFSYIPGLNFLAHRTVKSDGNSSTPKVSFSRSVNKNFISKISSNLKYVTCPYDAANQTYFSLDTGLNGRLFHRHYDDMQFNNEKGILIHFNQTIQSDKFSLEFINK